MKLVRSDSIIRITDFSWPWAAFSFLAGIVCLCGLARNLYLGIFSVQTAVMLICGIIGLGAGIILTQWSEFRFDKTQRVLAWKRRSLVWAGGDMISFDRIRCAVVQFISGTTPKSARSDWYRVALCTSDGGIVPLTTSYKSGRVSDRRCREIRAAINECLDVKLDSEDENDIRELQKAGDILKTELFIKWRYNLGITAAHERYIQMFG